MLIGSDFGFLGSKLGEAFSLVFSIGYFSEGGRGCVFKVDILMHTGITDRQSVNNFIILFIYFSSFGGSSLLAGASGPVHECTPISDPEH